MPARFSRSGAPAGRTTARAASLAAALAAALTAFGAAAGMPNAVRAAAGAAEPAGFYLRAGFGLDLPAGAAFTDRDCASASPDALYGCGAGPDGAPRRSAGDFGAAAAVEAGLGVNLPAAAAPALRFEFLVEYRPRTAFRGRANFLAAGRRQSVAADLSVLSGMAAAFIDLAALGVPKPGPFAPFAGAGAGLARIAIGKTRMTFPATTTIVPGARRTGFAWMATAGVAVALGARTTLDLAWRYTDLGVVRTGTGRGWVVWRDGSKPATALDLAPTRAVGSRLFLTQRESCRDMAGRRWDKVGSAENRHFARHRRRYVQAVGRFLLNRFFLTRGG